MLPSFVAGCNDGGFQQLGEAADYMGYGVLEARWRWALRALPTPALASSGGSRDAPSSAAWRALFSELGGLSNGPHDVSIRLGSDFSSFGFADDCDAAGNTIDVNLMPRPILRIRWVIPALQVLEKHVVVEKA